MVWTTATMEEMKALRSVQANLVQDLDHLVVQEQALED